MKRVLLLVGLTVVVAGAATAGWVAASRIKSPAQVAAEAEPPEPSLITVPVESRVISTDVVTRGDVRFDEPESIVAQGVALPGVAPVITWVPEAGSEFTEGDLLYEVSGRPVFALQGELPLFRTLTRTDEGEDVAQFQEALARLGFDPGEIDGVYGPRTERAAADFYAAAGYEMIEPSDEELQFEEAASDAAQQARRAYDLAKQAHDAAAAATAAKTAAADRVTTTTTAWRSAEAAVAAALASGLAEDDPQVVPLVTALAAASAEVEAASQALADATATAEAAAAEAAAFDLTEALRALRRADEDLRDVRSSTGRKVPASEIVFFDLFPLRVDTVNVARGDAAGGEIMRVSGSRLAIDSSVPTPCR